MWYVLRSQVGMGQIVGILVGQGEKMGFHSHDIWKPLKGFKQGVTRTDFHLKRPLWLLRGEGSTKGQKGSRESSEEATAGG